MNFEHEVLIIEDCEIDYEQFIQCVDDNFGIQPKNYEYTRHMNLFVERIDVVMNESLFSFDELKVFVLDNIQEYDQEILSIEFSKQVISINQIKNIFEKSIFEEKSNKKGWLVFIDPCNIANWSHGCEYWFVRNNKDIIKSKEKWPPSENIELVTLD